MSWLSSVIQVLLLLFQQQVYALKPFDPYKHDGSCTASMSMCSFELHATAAMTMFYKNLFRVIASDNGTLYQYDNFNRTFSMTDVLTGDGYPKLVRICIAFSSHYWNVLLLLLLLRFMFSTILYQVLSYMFIKIK